MIWIFVPVPVACDLSPGFWAGICGARSVRGLPGRWGCILAHGVEENRVIALGGWGSRRCRPKVICMVFTVLGRNEIRRRYWKGAQKPRILLHLENVVWGTAQKRLFRSFLGGSQFALCAVPCLHDRFWEPWSQFGEYRPSIWSGDAENPISNKSYVGKIVDKPLQPFNYSVLGYQSYLDPPEIALMDKLYFDAYRLGTSIYGHNLCEPIMRMPIWWLLMWLQ